MNFLERKEIEVLIDFEIGIQKKRCATSDEDEKFCLWQKLQEVQKEKDKRVEEIYKSAKNGI